MEIPYSNFFEVTIDSKKLLSHIQLLDTKIDQHQTKITEFKTFTNNFQDILFNKILKRLGDLNIEWQKKHKGNREDINHLRMLFKDHDKKTDMKFRQIQGLLNMTNNRIGTVKGQIEEDTCLKLSYFQKKMHNNITSQEFQKILREEILTIEEKIAKLAERQEEKSTKFEDEIKKSQKKMIDLMKKVQMQKISRGKEQGQGEEQPGLAVTLDSFPARSKSRSLGKKRAKTNFRRGGIMQNQTADIQQFSKIKTPKQVKVDDTKGRQLSVVILQKLESISNQYSNKLSTVEQKLSRATNRYQILNEQVGILNRKIDKYKSQQIQVSEIVKLQDDKNVDEKVIEEIKRNIKQMGKQFEESINTKVNSDVYDKTIRKMQDKIALFFNINADKANKNDLRNNFTFLQDKIKEIIIVLAEQKNFNKDGAVKRIPVKCLSCDKDLDPALSNQPQNIYGHRSTRSSLNLTARSSTGYLRKKARLGNTNSNNE